MVQRRKEVENGVGAWK